MAQGDKAFQHLALPSIFSGRAKLPGGRTKSPETLAHEKEPQNHVDYVGSRLDGISSHYKKTAASRVDEKKPTLPAGVPFLLRLDADEDPEFLKSAFNLEIVSETADGYVLVSTMDVELKEFREKLKLFLAGERGGGSASKVHEIVTPEHVQERLKRILSDGLFEIYSEIKDEAAFVVDIGVECQGLIKLPAHPEKQENQTNASFAAAIERWKARYQRALVAIDDLQSRREQELIQFIKVYNGALISITQDEPALYSLPDSITLRVAINGKCLKDLAENYPYIFDIQEIDVSSELDEASLGEGELAELTITPPLEGDSVLVVVDSGVQEGHLLLKDALLPKSQCLIPNTGDTADYVTPSGHGTRVAGAALFSQFNFDSKAHKHPFWIRNIRVLDENNRLPDKLFPPSMVTHVAKYAVSPETDAKVVNFSINGKFPCKLSYMSSWAAALDSISWESDLVVVQSAGNLLRNSHSSRQGFVDSLQKGESHPDYLLAAGCRIANPAQSMQAITVGAVGHAKYDDVDFGSLADTDTPVSYGTTGFGLWGAIKPDVVEYGGDYVFSKKAPISNRIESTTTLRLPRATIKGGPLVDADQVGTSFAAPRVAALAVDIATLLPKANSNLIKALIVNSARWPKWTESIKSKMDVLRLIGHGIPERNVALSNDEFRVTLITQNSLFVRPKEVHVYRIPIPADLRAPTNDKTIKISVCLSYTARPRRTRKTLQRYYSTWADWKSSRADESVNEFLARVSTDVNVEDATNHGAFPWYVGARTSEGIVGVKRSASAIQKDWFEAPAYALPENLCIAVVGHQGWDTDPNAVARYGLVVTLRSMSQEVPIYNAIEVGIEQMIEHEVQIGVN